MLLFFLASYWYNGFMRKKKGKQLNPGQVIIPASHPNPPSPNEVDIALVLSRHYETIVEFIIPVDDYRRKWIEKKVQFEVNRKSTIKKAILINKFGKVIEIQK